MTAAQGADLKGTRGLQTILIVDDSVTVRQQVGLALTQAGYRVVEAQDGRDALLILERGGISMIICDVNMPRMNGFEMLERLKLHPRHATIPVVMLTSERRPDLVERAKKAGASGWITKPFNAELLMAAMARILAT
jgi:two-component system chemotaxis response regulator CheY